MMLKIKLRYYSLLLALCLSTVTYAQIAAPAEQPTPAVTISSEPIPLDPKVHTGVLDNGFRYYIRKNAEPEERATFYLAMKVGSILEQDDERGLAHFLEHMAFNGTEHFPKNELISYLQSNGVRFGADLNAYTSFDETVYQLPIPTDDPEIITNGLQILRDWAGAVLLETDDIQSERGVIIEEKRGGKGAQQRMQQQYLPMLFNHSRYADRLPIGTEEVLMNFKPETLRSFYKRWYRPELQALIVVGDVDVETIEAMIKEKFSDLENPEDAPKRETYQVPLTGENQFMALTDPENPSFVIQVLMKQPGDTLSTTANFREQLKKVLFNNMMSARMGELRKQADPPFLNGSANITGFMAGLDAASASAAVKPEAGTLERGFKAVWTEVERVKRHGFTQTELDRIVEAVLTYQESRFKERNKTHSNSYVNDYLKHFLKGEASPGIEYEYEFYKSVLPGIRLEEVNALTPSYFTDNNRDILIMAPTKLKDSLPEESEVLSWISEIKQDSIGAYEDTVSDQPLLEETPEPGSIVEEKELPAVGATELTLSNGIKVVLKKTDFKNDEIRFTAFSPGGNSLYGEADYPSAQNATGLVGSSGLGNFTAIELPKVLSGKIARVSPYISTLYEGMSGSANPEDLDVAMKLLYLKFTAPRIDQDIFKGLITNYKSSLKTRSNSPNSVFSDTVRNVMGNYHYRSNPPSLEQADAISLERAFEIYKERFADASDFTFFFVGNITADSIRPLLETYVASLPAINREEKGKDLGIHPPSGHIRKTVYRGSEDKATVQLVFSGEYEYEGKSNLAMSALKEVLNIRLLERLREVEAGVYTPGVSVNYQKEPSGRYTAAVYFSCAPDHVDPLIQATLEEVRDIKKNGPKQEDLNKFKSETRRSRETAMETNGFWLSYLSDRYRLNESLNSLENFPKRLDELSVKDVQDVAGRYLDEENLIEFILLPEAAKK